ncbi:MAG: phosphate starvation-inducible protein PhoH [Lentisphaerae bacterium GWF2_52_8]|nr:MAG: phosphate starvation-inducible protein PhoH [Lentisphaerae bacterium GWF2_52_8]
MKKTFVLDTNVLLYNAQAIEAFEDNEIVLPMAVIEELDRFKKNQDELGRNARQVIRRIDELRSRGNLSGGVPLDNGTERTQPGILRIVTGKGRIKDSELDMDLPDHRILRVAYAIHKEGKSNVIFITKDINLRLKADALGLQVEDFENQKVNFDELFSGCREVNVSSSLIDEIYQNKSVEMPNLNVFPNEFVILKDENNLKHSALASKKDGRLWLLPSRSDEAIWNIRPRSKEQRMALELLMNPDIQIVTLVGQAGTGKTLLALAAALELVQKMKIYEKILVTRPIVPVGKDIGYLPGDKTEKLSHWMQPIYDNLDYLMHAEKRENSGPVRKYIEELMRGHKLEVEALTYIRGRSIPRQYVIVDEAQNLTPHEVKTIVSRAGEGTKMVLTGDPYQIDNPYLDASSNGLSYSVERMKHLPIHGHITLRKSERSPLAAAAAEYL